MNSVFISGSININKLNNKTIELLDNIIKKNIPVLIGDAKGIDFLVQKYFASKQYFNVTVYTILNSPRNILSNKFKIKKINYFNLKEFLNLSDKEKKQISFSERKKQAFKDIELTNDADFLLVIWDGKSQGSKNNIIRGLEQNKKIKVIYYDKIIGSPNIEISEIEKIYEENNGIGIREIQKRLNLELGEENIPTNNFIKEDQTLHSLYPTYTKTFLRGHPEFSEYIVSHEYKGKVSLKYKPSIISILKNKILEIIDKKKENLLFD